MQKEQMKAKIESMTPDQVQELLRILGNCKSGNGPSQQMTQKTISLGVGALSEPYQTEKSSSKEGTRTVSENGSTGI